MNIASSPKPVSLTLVNEHRLDTPELSGLVALPGRRFLAVEDERGLFLSTLDGPSRRLLKPKKKANDFEGVTLAPNGQAALVLSEAKGDILRVSLTVDEKAETLGRLPKIGKEPGYGWEGIGLLPASSSWDGAPHIVAVHQGKPRRVGIFSYPELQEELMLKLPKSADKYLPRLSDIAVDPIAGHFFLVSAKSNTVVELLFSVTQKAMPGGLRRDAELSMLGHFVLPEHKDRPEALAFSEDGKKLWVGNDGKGRVFELAVNR